jgi:hypothetical protein
LHAGCGLGQSRHASYAFNCFFAARIYVGREVDFPIPLLPPLRLHKKTVMGGEISESQLPLWREIPRHNLSAQQNP